MQKDNATWALAHLMGRLAIPVTRRSISDELEKHPNYNSLRAFSDVLDRWNIPNAAYKFNHEELADVPTPYIAHLKNEFAVVTRFDNNGVEMLKDGFGKKNFSTEEFKKRFTGSVLLADKEDNSGEPDYQTKLRKQQLEDLRLPVFFTGAATLLIAFLLQTNFFASLTLPIALLTLFKTAGLATAILLLIQSIDANNPLVQRLCGDDKKSCSAILSSKAAKVPMPFGIELSWSEVGFFYFAGTWLALVFGSRGAALLHALAILNILALPYTLYSIYYQWRVAKQWCRFCLVVQAILWLEFFALLPYLLPDSHWGPLSTAEWASLISSLTAPILLWIIFKPFLLQSKQLKPLKQQLRTFKYNTDLFHKLMNEEVQYALPAHEDTLIIGNPEAEKIITMVANPYCQPCAKAHKALEWLDNRSDVKLQVVFSTSDKAGDKKAEVAAHLLSLQNSKGGATVKQAMHDWYEQKQKNYESWASIYPAEKMEAGTQLQKQREWCKMAEISGTPTLFINGRRLPTNYQPEDLKYFI